MRIFNSESEYEALLLENAARAVSTHLGEFYPDCSYGSGAFSISKEPKTVYAVCEARRSLRGQDGIYVISAGETQNGFDFTVLLNGSERRVSVSV